MRPRTRQLIALLLLGAAGLCGAWACSAIRGAGGGHGTIIFSHARHVAQADCADCHGEVAKSSGPTRGAFLPRGHEGCGKCHEEEVAKRCEMCHRGAREGVSLTRVDRRLRFSHAAHLGRSATKDCTTCHPRAAEAARVPGHATCNAGGCHRDAYKGLGCTKCHEDLQRQAGRPATVIEHGPSFARTHGATARGAIAACAQCHDQTFCGECHARTSVATPSILFPEKIDRSFIHRGDFIGRHAIEARSSPASCLKCHGQRSCRACHALNGLAVAPDPKLQGSVTRQPHPAGWNTTGSPDHHGRPARQDIARCASCHDRGAVSNCVGCHTVGGSGGSPHPRAWSWRDKTGQCRSSSMCAVCHVGGRGCR